MTKSLDLRQLTDLPEWVCKCVWHATATTIVVPAKDEHDAKTVAWKRVARMEGGNMCLNVTVRRK